MEQSWGLVFQLTLIETYKACRLCHGSSTENTKDVTRRDEYAGVPPQPCYDASHGTQLTEWLCMFPLHCNGWGKIYHSWVACRPINLKSDHICMIRLGNLCKHADTLLCLVKKHQICILDWSSLILLLWEVRMVRNEVKTWYPLGRLSSGNRSMDSYLMCFLDMSRICKT